MRGRLAWMCALLAVGAQGAPRIRVEPPEVVFGTVALQDFPGAEVLVLNEGDEPLQLIDVAMTCGDCFTVSTDTNVAPPGGMIKLLLQVEPTRLAGFAEPHVLVINSNDPERPFFGVPIHVDAAPVFSRTPDALFFDGVYSNSVRRQAARVQPRVELRQPLTRVQSDKPFLIGRVRPDLYRDGAYRVDVETVPPLPEGWQDATIEVATADPADPVCLIPASLFVLPPFHVSPETLKVAPVRREQLRILFIRQHLSPPARLTAVELPDPGMRYEVHVDNHLANPRINVYFNALEGQAGDLGDVVLRTDQTAFQEIRIPVEVSSSYRQELKPNPYKPVRRRGCCGSRR